MKAIRRRRRRTFYPLKKWVPWRLANLGTALVGVEVSRVLFGQTVPIWLLLAVIVVASSVFATSAYSSWARKRVRTRKARILALETELFPELHPGLVRVLPKDAIVVTPTGPTAEQLMQVWSNLKTQLAASTANDDGKPFDLDAEIERINDKITRLEEKLRKPPPGRDNIVRKSGGYQPRGPALDPNTVFEPQPASGVQPPMTNVGYRRPCPDCTNGHLYYQGQGIWHCDKCAYEDTRDHSYFRPEYKLCPDCQHTLVRRIEDKYWRCINCNYWEEARR